MVRPAVQAAPSAPPARPVNSLAMSRLPAALRQAARPSFFTTQAQARAAMPPDVAGQAVKFRAGKGYYIGSSAAAAPAAKTGAAAGTAPTDLQTATQQVQTAYVDPLLTAIRNAEAARSAQGQQAITGYTTAEQALLGNEPSIASAAYGGAMQGQNAIDAAIASTLQGSGTANADALAGKLASIAADPGTAARINGQAASDVTGNVGAQYASHSATLSALNQEGQAAQNYLRAQPGIAGLAGLQASQGLQGQINQDLQTQLGTVQQNVPQMIQDAVSNIQKARADAASQKLAAEKVAIDAGKATVFGSATGGYYALDPATGKVAQITAGTGQPPKVFGSAKSGYYALDPSTGKATQLTAPVAGGGSTTHLQTRSVNGHTVVFDPSTGVFYTPGTGQPVDPNTLTKPPKPLSASVQAKVAQTIGSSKNGYWGSTTDGSRVSRSDIVAAAKAAGETMQQFLQDAKAQQAQGIGWVAPVQDVSKDDPEINHIYTNLISTYGIDAKQAFKQVAKAFPGWGARNQKAFFGSQPGQPASASTGATPDVPKSLATPQQAQAYARSVAQKQYGWGPSEFASLQTLWNNESGWRFDATNPKSGASGIPQAIGHQLPSNYATDPAVQIQWGLNYIKQRYGTPSKALAFWYSTKPPGEPQGHWY